MRKPALRALATGFHERLKTVKSRNPLGTVDWYPWVTLAAFEVMDRYLKGDTAAFLKMMGSDPVLDAGCGDGDISFFLESLGARVDAIDHAPTNYNAMVGVRRLKELLDSQVAIHSVDLDTRPHLPASRYGLAVMLGVLYHLKNPFLVLETLARHSRYLFLSTRIASLTPDRRLSYEALPMAYLVEEDELNQDCTNFWIFSEPALRRVVRRSGWNILHFSSVGAPVPQSDPVTSGGDTRAYLLAESRFAAPLSSFQLDDGWHALEPHRWRWTEQRFGVSLDLPEPRESARLRFLFHIPEEMTEQRPVLTLSATVNGSPLPAAVYSTPGEHEYTGELRALGAGRLQVRFELDKPFHPGGGDQRELGVLVDFSGAFPIVLE